MLIKFSLSIWYVLDSVIFFLEIKMYLVLNTMYRVRSKVIFVDDY